MMAVRRVPFVSTENFELWAEPFPSTREKDKVELASGSVAVNCPTREPIAKLSNTELPLRSRVEGGRLGIDFRLRGSVPAASSTASENPSLSSSGSR